MLSHVWLFVTPWIVAHQAPLFMVFPRQEYWSGLPSLGDLLDPGIESASLTLAGGFFTTEQPWKLILFVKCLLYARHPSRRFFSFWLCPLSYGDLSPLNRDWICTLSSECEKSWSVDCQGIPYKILYVHSLFHLEIAIIGKIGNISSTKEWRRLRLSETAWFVHKHTCQYKSWVLSPGLLTQHPWTGHLPF